MVNWYEILVQLATVQFLIMMNQGMRLKSISI